MNEKIRVVKQNTVTDKWLCLGCRFLLGYVENKKIIRIKRKDLYVTVTGGSVKVLCPRCAKENELVDDGKEG